MSTAAVISTSGMSLPPLPRPHPMRATMYHALPTPPPSLSPSPPTTYRPMGPDRSYRFNFERLPPELQREILSRLDYQSLIALSCTNRYLNQTVDPAHLADPADKFAFVMRAENYFPRHFPVVVQGQERPGNFACYVCFRVRGPAHFDADQPHSIYVNDRGERVDGLAPLRGADGKPSQARALPPPGCKLVSLRRFCIECGVRHGLHQPGDSLFTKLRQELWVCRCRMVWQKPTCLKCTRCGGDCPLRAKAKS
ncbi:uncharacterized protein DNG_08817 [Cephalotrichum gorgonifer]|uniref:F-box domain-containing protein n=1 Tax=Cephalotrichum gorgonifer TaxID=2041049 RepID=A0AAE8N6P2_9PEZI|nr:uncharacterized protein DNG_08817 [Cephalotrichum gorgonifer]